MKRRSGFTLLELLVTIGIIGIIAATSIPSYAAAQRRLTVNQTSAELADVLQAARTKAMTSGADIEITITSSSVSQKNLRTNVTTIWAPPSGITFTTASLILTRLTGLAVDTVNRLPADTTITIQNSRTVEIASNGKISLP